MAILGRRSLLAALPALFAAPAIVRADALMPISGGSLVRVVGIVSDGSVATEWVPSVRRGMMQASTPFEEFIRCVPPLRSGQGIWGGVLPKSRVDQLCDVQTALVRGGHWSRFRSPADGWETSFPHADCFPSWA